MVRLSDMSFFRARRARRIEYLSQRISALTETINGIEEEFWPEDYQEFCEMRRLAAIERSDLIKRQGA